MQEFPDHWDLKTKIDYLQRKIIIFSIAYYMLSESIVTDRTYDLLSRQLVQMHEEYGDISSTQYGYVMYDFDGTTGFDLYGRLTDHDKLYLLNIARKVAHK